MRAVVVVDLGFGDSGKGSVTDWLVRKHDAVAVCRYSGGPQAAHRVVLDDGREHVFSQFGSGTFVPGVQTFLSEFMLVNPLNLFAEERGLQKVGVTDALERLAVDRRALVVTPFHVMANRLRELARGDRRHGSCGEGVGEAMHDFLNGSALFVGDLASPDLKNKLLAIQEAKRREIASIFGQVAERVVFDDPDYIENFIDGYRAFAEQVRIVDFTHLLALHNEGTVIYEGAQGVLLDQDYGFHPYTTWTRTTTENAYTLMMRAPPVEDTVVGVLRAYATRHGPGPFPTEDESLNLPDAANGVDRWQGGWRVGHFDALLARYALRVTGGVDGLALTCVDRVEDEWKLCDSYTYTGTLPDLEPYLRTNGSLIEDLWPIEIGRTNAHAEALTNRLIDCAPHYLTYPREQLIPQIEEWLGFPVVLTSHGPTANDKVETGNPQKRSVAA